MSNLRKAVINQMGGLEIFKQSFNDVVRNGAEGGKSDEVTAVQNALSFFALEEVAHDEERREEENAEPLELTSYNYATN